MLPKIHSAEDLDYVSRSIRNTAMAKGSSRRSFVNIVPSIESAKASWNLGEIAGWKSDYGFEAGGRLTALLVRSHSVSFLGYWLMKFSLLLRTVHHSFPFPNF